MNVTKRVFAVSNQTEYPQKHGFCISSVVSAGPSSCSKIVIFDCFAYGNVFVRSDLTLERSSSRFHVTAYGEISDRCERKDSIAIFYRASL